MARDHQVFVGLDDISADPAVRRGDAGPMSAIGSLVELNAEPGARTTDRAADRGRVLAHAGGEHDAVDATHRRRQRSDMARGTMAKNLDGELCARLLAGQQLAEIGGNAGEAEHARAPVE